jgi:hypothetical protein
MENVNNVYFYMFVEIIIEKPDFCVASPGAPRSWGNAVAVVLTTDWTTGVRSLAETKDFSSSSETHLTSYPMGRFPGVKRGPGLTLTTDPYLLPRSRMSRRYTSSTPYRLHGVAGQLYLYFTYFII